MRASRPAPGRPLAALAVVAVLVAACGGRDAGRPAARDGGAGPAATDADSADFRQVMVGYAVAGQRLPFRRTKEEARRLAQDVIDQARRGGNFDELIRRYTDDLDPRGLPFNGGSYTIAWRTTAAMPAVRAAVAATPVGRVHPAPVDTGLAYLVILRDR